MSEKRARGFNRRLFLKGTAAVSLGTAASASLGTAVSGPWMVPAAAAEPAPMPPHGAELRGMDLVVESPNSEGRFGFMFKDQPPFRPSDDLLKHLGQEMEEQPVKGDPHIDPVTGQPGTPATVGNNENDAFNENPNPKLTSGFTFVGQFVDHDITFDTTPIDQQEEDPDATTNFRVPRYDLDALYGRGPSQDPQLYDSADRDKFKLVKTTHTTIRSDTLKTPEVVYDVPRDANGKAIIADRRNDQTIIINQMHVAMQMFHNKLVDYMRALRVPRAAVFESARRLARWHYQWMVTHDFLPAIVGQKMADSVYKEVLTGVPIINIKYYKPTNPLGRPFIPVEFSVAAYRFGHSMTRPRYTVRDVSTAPTQSLVSPSRACRCSRPIRRQQLERVPSGAGSAEDSVEQVLQPGRGAYRPAGATVRRVAGRRVVLDAPDGLARHRDEREPPLGAKPQAGKASGSALGTAGGSADGCDAAHERRAVAEPPYLRARSNRRQRGGDRGSARRVRRGEPGPHADLRR